MNTIFAKTRYVYDSYTDYWRLVELSGFPICYVDEMDVYNPANIYIISPMNGEIYDFMNIARRVDHISTLYQWNLERPGGSGDIERYVNDNRKGIF